MYHDKQPPDPLESDGGPTALLDTFSDAVIFLDQTATILSANEKAAAIAGTDKHILPGNSLWQAIPQLTTTIFYQAMTYTIRTHTSFQMTYRSPITRTRFHMYLSPTTEGVALFFHEETDDTASWVSASQGQGGHLESAENVPEWITILTPEGLLLEINQRPLNETGIQRERVIGKPFTQFPAWSAESLTQKQLRSAIAQASKGGTTRFEAKLCPQAGWSLDMAFTLTPHLNTHQQVEYIICSGRDITERKHTEEELRSLVNTLPQLIWIARADGYLIYNNQRLIDYLAITLDQIEGYGWLECLHPDDRQRTLDTWQAALQTGGPYEIEYRLRNTISGTYRWFLVRGMPQRDVKGTILSWIGTATDINEQKQARERLKDSEQKFRTLAETMPQHVWTLLPDGRIDYTNQRYQQYHNVTQGDLEGPGGQSWHQFVHPDDLEQALSHRQHLLDTGETYESECRFMNPQTGEYRWFLVRTYPMHNDAGQVIKWFITATDIDEQKRTEEALRQSQRQVQALMASTIIGIFISEEERIIEANDTFLHMTGYSREDLYSGQLNWMHMTPPEYHDATRQVYEHVAFEPLAPYEKEYIGKDGRRCPVVVGATVIQQNPIQAISFVLDNSARKSLEQRKDTFINMASHELKTPLTILKMQTQLLRRRLEKQGHHQAARTFLRVEEPIQRLERLIAELLDVSKMEKGELDFQEEPVHLNTLLHEATETMQQIHHTHAIVLQEEAELTVMGDKGRLEQIIINLLSNAIKFSPNAQKVDLSLSTTAENAIIKVRDYGVGIPQELREKIFERFYRASDTQLDTIPGLGMGLYIVEEVVKQHQGTITVESEMSKGSTFQVTLPLKKEPKQANGI